MNWISIIIGSINNQTDMERKTIQQIRSEIAQENGFNDFTQLIEARGNETLYEEYSQKRYQNYLWLFFNQRCEKKDTLQVWNRGILETI